MLRRLPLAAADLKSFPRILSGTDFYRDLMLELREMTLSTSDLGITGLNELLENSLMLSSMLLLSPVSFLCLLFFLGLLRFLRFSSLIYSESMLSSRSFGSPGKN